VSVPALFVGIDIGTTAVKASVIDEGGRPVSEASQPYPTAYLRPGWVEQDPADWWHGTVTAVRGALRPLTGDQLSSVLGIGVSAQAPTLLALDASGAPLRPALIWMDRRAGVETAALGAEVGEAAIVHTTANRLDPFFVAPKLRWLADNEPDVLAATDLMVQINGYIAYRLTGEHSLDEQHASILGVRRIAEGDWWGEMLSAVGVDRTVFPPIRAATDVIGAVTPAASAETGLPIGIPVVAGTVDSAAAALEAGVTAPGQAAEMTGTSTVVVMPSERPLNGGAFITMASALRGQWLALAAMVATGASLHWLRNLTGHGADFDTLTTEAGSVPPGAGGLIFLPYMMGERSPIWDSAARGVLVGLNLGTGRAELTRAVLEGTAFALRHNLEAAASAGLRVEELRSLGGATRSDLWCQIKADVTGVPIVRMKASTGATFGDAALAAVGVGHHPDLASFVSAAAVADRVFQPSDAAYDDFYGSYRRSYSSLRPEFPALAGAAERTMS
jgi:xylulokinase